MERSRILCSFVNSAHLVRSRMGEEGSVELFKPDRGCNWSDKEIRALISVWSDDVIQAELEGAHRNQHVYKKMSAELGKLGYRRTWDKCRDKVKKLKQEYKKVVDNNNETGRKRKTFKFMEEMDAVLGHRPSITPPVTVSSAKSDQETNEEEQEVSSDDAGIEESSTMGQVSMFLDVC